MNTRRAKSVRSLRGSMRGVTMMELMIVVVIVSILAVVGYPNYRDYAARAKRNEAKSALLQIATQQERFYLQNNTYTNDMTKLGFPTSPYKTPSKSYNVSISGATPNNYKAVAKYLNNDKEKTRCETFEIDGNMVKKSLPLLDCWVRTR